MEALRRRSHLAELVAGETAVFRIASAGPRSASVNIRGVEPENFAIRGVAIAEGRAVTHSDVTLRRRVVVLGRDRRSASSGRAWETGCAWAARPSW